MKNFVAKATLKSIDPARLVKNRFKFGKLSQDGCSYISLVSWIDSHFPATSRVERLVVLTKAVHLWRKRKVCEPSQKETADQSLRGLQNRAYKSSVVLQT